MQTPPKYKMTLNLNVLNHLGINLYSNVPSVLSEVVANSWDADAELVAIDIDPRGGTVTVTDNGAGMDLNDVNSRFLMVGYERRKQPGGAVTPKHNRKVMGRKGIGKLSLFSIARVVEVYTVKNGERNAFVMDVRDIERIIKGNLTVDYEPTPLEINDADFAFADDTPTGTGTRIVLSDMKKNLGQAASGLRKRLARRFAITGPGFNFTLSIGGRTVTIADRDYFHKLQYVWSYGEQHDDMDNLTPGVEEREERSGATDAGKISGWIGTVKNSGSLKGEEGENLNQIVLMVRGKLAHEAVLEEFNEGGVYSSYLIGEITADFLDDDDHVDIATSSRQRIIEDDPRYRTLLEFIQKELRYIQSQWSDLRSQDGTREARTDPLIDKWFGTLRGDSKRKAQRLFGKINQLTVDAEDDRRQLFAHGVLAFETMRQRDMLDSLDGMDITDIPALAKIFTSADDLEGALYHKIATQRIAIITTLRKLTDEDAKERVLQMHLFNHLWLLDPAWERASEGTMEDKIGRQFKEISESLTEEQRNARIDIQYKRSNGQSVIVELKRYKVVVSTSKLLDQVGKYRDAVRRALRDVGRPFEQVEVVCIVGKDLSDWSELDGRDESAKTLAGKNIRVVKYDELIDQALASYKAYLESELLVSPIRDLMSQLERGASADLDLAQPSLVTMDGTI